MMSNSPNGACWSGPLEVVVLAFLIFSASICRGEDLNPAFQNLLDKAEEGNLVAQCLLGTAYDFGILTSRDPQKAVHWYRIAVDRGNLAAQCNLGVMLCQGDGISLDQERGIKLLKQAAEGGDPFAQFNLQLLDDARLQSLEWMPAQQTRTISSITCREDGIGSQRRTAL
jgi:TPR repeat protein